MLLAFARSQTQALESGRAVEQESFCVGLLPAAGREPERDRKRNEETCLETNERPKELKPKPDLEPQATKPLDGAGSAEGAMACPARSRSSTNCVLCFLPIQDSNPHYLYHRLDSSPFTGNKVENPRSENDDRGHSPLCYKDEPPTWCCHDCAVSLEAPFLCPKHHRTMEPYIILTGSGSKRYAQFFSERVTDQDNKVVIAIKKNNTDALKHALDHGNRRLLGPYNSMGETPLHLAVNLGRLSCAKILLDMGADPNLCNSRDITPIDAAAISEHMDIAIALWGENDEFNSQLLSSAARNGDEKIVKLMLGKDGVKIGAKNERFGNTPLHLASGSGYQKVVQILLNHHAAVNATNNNHETPLHYAAYNGSAEACNTLINHGASLDAMDSRGDTPLMDAVNRNHCAVVGCLLDAGANCGMTDSGGNTPLHLAAAMGLLDICSRLIGHNAKLGVENSDGRTPLILAVANNCIGVVNLLLDSGSGVYIHAADNSGYTSLHWAANNGSVDICTTLLNHNASTRIKSGEEDDFVTPLLVAVVNNHADVVRLLLERGAYGSNQHDNTIRRWNDFPLFEAVSRGSISCLEPLLKYCKIDFEFEGLNAIAHAARFGKVAVVKVLLDKGASGFPPKGLKGEWKNLNFDSKGKANMSEVLKILKQA